MRPIDLLFNIGIQANLNVEISTKHIRIGHLSYATQERALTPEVLDELCVDFLSRIVEELNSTKGA
jgi:hypothetical protein